ncbi:hypothetical protein Clacol_007413 [Clathrus columnatus]|uniref:Lanosterol 14-alpha-demethylase n=1 Tax=Clathrus columnatus TaxID=1419009 RepID=A0AAV5AHE7_9AGAM|nr:hypothetical protein Clacol_007413 [Clathrus columnatus]
MSNFTAFTNSETWTAIASPKSAILLLINLPLIAVVLNVLSQLLISKNPNDPPLVFHWLPYVGSAVQYGTDPINFFVRCQKKYGNVFTFVLFGRRVTVALGPKGNNLILGGKLSEVSAEEAYTHLTTPVFGAGVVYDCPNNMLMEQKKFVKVGLSIENFRQYVGMIVNEVEDFLDTDPAFFQYQTGDINEWGKFPAYKKLAELIILTASRTLQGHEVRESLHKGFADRYHDLDGGFTPLNFLFPNLPLASYRKRDVSHKAMSDFYISIIEKRRQENRIEEGDMLSALSQQTYKDGRPLTDREMAHIMIALLMAGQHTSSTSTTWCLLHVVANPEIADALYKEQVEHFGQDDGSLASLTYEELKTLPLLDAVIRETLRTHPPIHSIMRKVISDIVVPPTLSAPRDENRTYIIPKGHFVLASPAVSHMDAAYWKDPEEFDPYRWFDQSGAAAAALDSYDNGGDKIDYGFGQVSKGTESPYQPFGAGRHRCIGEQFAYLQIGTVISTLIRRLEMRIEKGVPEHNYQTLITQPQGECGVLYRRRPDPKKN